MRRVVAKYRRGSEWRKWDLHVHAPGTKLNDGYLNDWDGFCRTIEESDVAVLGITDYFSVENFFEFKRQYLSRYPETGKVFFPNIELRLNETVNKDVQSVEFHLIFRPDEEEATLSRFIANCRTQITVDNRRNLTCAELTGRQYESATVTRDDLEKAIRDTFGNGDELSNHVLLIVPANNGGIRAESGAQRKANLAIQIDELANGVFGSQKNREHYLSVDRYNDRSRPSRPKPVFAGSDAHSIAQLQTTLGKEVKTDGISTEVTWVKADPTYEGLLQTIVEPEERVRIQPVKPDFKEPYKYISQVRFSGTDEFPDAIDFNSNLVSIIGSRSSGKSALLAHIAHAVDPDYTEEQQRRCGLDVGGKTGPGAGWTWDQVASIKCEVEWGGNPASSAGKVVYVPQNSLFAISSRPGDVSSKIQPVLYRIAGELQAIHERVESELNAANAAIRRSVDEWFELRRASDDATREIKDLGDRAVIASLSDSLRLKIEELRIASTLTAEEAAAYQSIVDRTSDLRVRQSQVADEAAVLDSYVQFVDGEYSVGGDVRVEFHMVPLPSVLPRAIAQQLEELIARRREELQSEVRGRLSEYRKTLQAETEDLRTQVLSLESGNALLIEKNRANSELEDLVRNQRHQVDILGKIDGVMANLQSLRRAQLQCVEQIEENIAARDAAIRELIDAFHVAPRSLDDMDFGIESELPSEEVRAVSDLFNRQEKTRYFDRAKHDGINLAAVMDGVGLFMEMVRSGRQKLKAGQSASAAVSGVLTLTPEIRYCASIEGDRIGGFDVSSMTPGKQALFALTLIMNESDEPWPLLIDQPEDDLDSRSIYRTIVPFLTRRKRDRQILMVTHDANLAVGADSEQIVVANRHGKDRKNRDGRTFVYFTGSMEHSVPKNGSDIVLESCGIREHACDILDGGEDAFRRRGAKYKV